MIVERKLENFLHLIWILYLLRSGGELLHSENLQVQHVNVVVHSTTSSSPSLILQISSSRRPCALAMTSMSTTRRRLFQFVTFSRLSLVFKWGRSDGWNLIEFVLFSAQKLFGADHGNRVYRPSIVPCQVEISYRLCCLWLVVCRKRWRERIRRL